MATANARPPIPAPDTITFLPAIKGLGLDVAAIVVVLIFHFLIHRQRVYGMEEMINLPGWEEEVGIQSQDLEVYLRGRVSETTM